MQQAVISLMSLGFSMFVVGLVGGTAPVVGVPAIKNMRGFHKALCMVVGLALIGVGGFLVYRDDSSAQSPVAAPSMSVAAPQASETTPSPSGVGSTSATAVATGAGTPTDTAGSATYLTALQWAQNTTAYAPVDNPVTIGRAAFTQSLGLTCQNVPTFIAYTVADYKHFEATIGVPNNTARPPAPNSVVKVTFFKDGTSTPIGPPYIVSIGNPQTVRLALDNVTELDISCVITPSNGFALTDIALGNPALS